MHMLCPCCDGTARETPHGLIHRASRRAILQTGLAAAAIAALPRAARAQTTLSPPDAVKALLDGNRRFIDHRLTSFDEDLAIIRQKTVAKQEPFAAVLACADSRVPVELIFDQNIGRLFVTRVAGNIASADIIASLEYGAAVLGTTAILVLGHANCGAVKAAMAGKPVPGQISTLYAPLQPAVAEANGNLEAAIKDNAKIQANLLATASPVLADLIKKGELEIVAGYYTLDTGRVALL